VGRTVERSAPPPPPETPISCGIEIDSRLPSRLPAEPLLRALLAGVAVAAGLTGLLLLAFPGSTGRYFSWGLGPAPLTSLIGGSYVASLFVFGVAIRASWSEARGLVAGTLALTIPIIVVTFAHLDVFDFGRWQAWAWVALFIASPVSFGALLYVRRGLHAAVGPALPDWVRAIAAALAVGFLALAIALWWSPARISNVFPFDLPGLGGRVLGCWSSFLAFLAGWAALRGRADEARIPLLALAAFTAGALVGAVRNLSDLQPPARRFGYLVALVILLGVTSLVALRTRTARRTDARATER
jgi:hypothetical protein